jgi:hypothetical protein
MKQLFDKASEAVNSRTAWEQKQRLFYQMRHDGIRRRNKPWAGAADLHFPLIDMNMRKAKPFWESQATSTERLAQFVALQEQQAATTTAAAEFFDFELKQRSNFQIELIRAIDGMLLRGRGVMKATTDPFNDHRLTFAAIDLLFIIVADGADDFEDADWFVEVKHLSVAKYKRDRLYSQEPDVINQIRGSKELDITTEQWADKEVREGINYSRNPDQIIIWEHWEKTMGGWTVYTYSPMQPDVEIRRPFGCPYKCKGKPSLPYFSFRTEVKDAGWYSPRGVAELNAPFEAYACKLWNEKTDAMTFSNRPIFTADNDVPNSGNIRWVPGEFIPGNVRSVKMEGPAFSFDQEIAFARVTAEQQTMLPDFGISQPGQPDGTGGKPRTATENQRIAQLQNVGTESNGRLFRIDLGRLYSHCWGLMLQFKRKEVSFFVAGQLKTLPEQALHDSYIVMPDGAPDQWNKQLRFQRALMRMQTFTGHPNVDQEALARAVLAEDDPQFAVEAFIPTNLKAATEAEDEAVEIMILAAGFPAAVKPNEDHATRIFVLMGWLQKQSMTGAPVDPIARQRVQEHLAIHFELLKQIQPEAAQQVLQQVAGAEGGGPGPGQAPGQQMGPMGQMGQMPPGPGGMGEVGPQQGPIQI